MAGAHLYGWPAARGGSQSIADALASYLRSLGGEIRTGDRVESLADLPSASLVLADLTPDVFARVAGDRLPSGYLRKVMGYRRGPAAFKLDLALDGPIPWADPDLARAGTVHLAGTLEEIAEAEARVWRGDAHPRPFVLVAQQSAFDATRAPAGKHTVWAYAHVPHRCASDQTDTILERIEAYAPGFRDRIIGMHVADPSWFERHNPNLVGGDITGGAHTFGQLLFRPFLQRDPYATPLDGVFLCSSATPPGAGVHGMCGHNAALRAMRWS
jgi:phytoene dehydrogenase-like protein